MSIKQELRYRRAALRLVRLLREARAGMNQNANELCRVAAVCRERTHQRDAAVARAEQAERELCRAVDEQDAAENEAARYRRAALRLVRLLREARGQGYVKQLHSRIIANSRNSRHAVERAQRERDEAKAQVIAQIKLVAKLGRQRDAARAEVGGLREDVVTIGGRRDYWKSRANRIGGEVASMRAMLGEWCSAIEGNCEAPYDDTLALLEADDD